MNNYYEDALSWAAEEDDPEILREYAQQRAIIDEIKAEMEAKMEEHKQWEVALKDELLRRMAEKGVKALAVENVGKASRVERNTYRVVDADELLKHVLETKSIAIFNTSLNKAAIDEYTETAGHAPRGVSLMTEYSLRLTRAK